MRAHREAFGLALELGITPKDAAKLIALREAKARDEEATRRLAAKMAAAATPAAAPLRDERWMMRD